jgi:hypothetical protein
VALVQRGRAGIIIAAITTTIVAAAATITTTRTGIVAGVPVIF